MNRLTEDLLTMARVESQELEMRPAPVRADVLVRDAVEAMRGLVQDESADLEIGETTAGGGLRRYGLGAAGAGQPDRERDQVWAGAQRGAEPGGGERARGQRDRDWAVEFSVRDFGQGIASEHLGRASSSGSTGWTRRGRGSRAGPGWASAIARHMVESQGGRSGAESELNAGSNFLVVLPKAQTRAGTWRVERSRRDGAAGASERLLCQHCLASGLCGERVYFAFHGDVTFSVTQRRDTDTGNPRADARIEDIERFDVPQSANLGVEGQTSELEIEM